MSDQNLPAGAFLTTLNGRRCTAVPRSDAPAPAATSTSIPAIGVANASSSNNAVNAQAAPTEAPDAAAAADPAGGAGFGIQADAPDAADPAAASTTSSITLPEPDPDPILGIAQVSQAQAQAQAEVQATQAADIASPSPETSPTIQALTPQGVPEEPSPPPPPPTSPTNPTQPQGIQFPAENSQTDNNTVPTQVIGAADEQADQPEPPAPTPVVPVNDNANADVVNGNIEMTGGVDGAVAAGDNSVQPTTSPVSDGGDTDGGSRPPTAVVAGSVAGGVAVVSVICFLLWFWRKKAINKRRSSLLTPLTIAPSSFNGGKGGGEKGYIIDRGSLGPTPASQKFKAAVGANFKRIKGKMSKSGPSVDLNRGTSQFMDSSAASQHSRGSSGSSVANTLAPSSREVVTGKDRFKDWWSRVTADVNFNWKVRSDGATDPDPASAARDMRERRANGGSQPDFLTLLGMDEREVQREAERRQHGKNGSTGGSSNHFLGGLDLNLDSSSNPFSDMNALSHDSAKPAPLTVSPRVGANPFSDDNALGRSGSVKAPTTYVADVRRSRGAPTTGTRTPGYDRVDSLYRDSVLSEDNNGPRRNKFRSDPFDLDRPELLGSRQDLTTATMSGAAGGAPSTLGRNGSVNKPRRAHMRGDSIASKYSSGFSLGDWSDPGPDVGPAATRWDSSPTESYRPGSRQRGGSESSVGRAL